MKVTEFSENTKVDHVSPPWEKYLSEDDFISYLPSYKGNIVLDRFDEYTHKADKTGDITYYFYDAVKNGTAKQGEPIPLLIFIHGATNSFDGKICVGHSGAEMFATEKYQHEMGKGAYIAVPLANEKKDEKGNLCDSWDERYYPYLKEITEKIKSEYPVSKVIILGGSSGGYMSWAMTLEYPDLFDACAPVSSGFMPTIEQLKMLEEKDISVLYACGKHDEFNCYRAECEDVYNYIAHMKNGICYIPEWTRNGDHGVASLYFGIEMGQHCMITQLQANLMYTDGTPYCDQIPNGITGWIKDISEK